MGSREREPSRVEENRMAATIAVGSLLVAIGLAIFYWRGWLGILVPAEGPVMDALPLILFLLGFLIALTIWGWSRVLSLFDGR